MKKRISIHLIICITLCCLLLIKYIFQATSVMFPFLSLISGIDHEAASIGIIGGADGPTAVFLSSKVKFLFLLKVMEFIAIIYISIILFQCYRIIKKK